jgi:alkanesulfonate monooxygenase SsuD/methylene tetrahydromethanopterin reductase-like flavin-dependent oxidoreductase (luciferase family)
MSVKVGVTLPQFGADASRLLDAAQEAEALGLDSIWLFDHLWPLSGGKERPILEGWTTLAWLASKTTRIGIGTLVTRSSLRHPAVLAKMAATVASVAPGRLTVAIGSGDNLSRPENEAFGLPYHEGADRADQLRSTVEVLNAWRNGGRVSINDDFVEVAELPASPVADHAVWVAGRSPSVLDLTADLADGWNAWQGSPARFSRNVAYLKERTERALELSWGGIVMPGEDDRAAMERLGSRDPGGFLVGGPDTLAPRLQAFVDAGAEHLTLTLGGPWGPDDLRLLAVEVRDRLT